MPRTLQTHHPGSDGCVCHIINVITGGMVGIQCWGRGFITYAHTVQHYTWHNYAFMVLCELSNEQVTPTAYIETNY